MKTSKMLRYLSLPVTLLAFATAILLQTGCVAILAGGAGAGAVAYVRGELQANVEAPVDRTYAAARDAIAALQFNEISAAADAVSGEIIARTSQDDRIRIRINEETPSITEVAIRIGTFGDEKLSRRILEEIQNRL